MNARVDHIGKRFGRLTVLSLAESAKGHARWHCACDCGVRTITSSSHLTTGHSTSCGCAAREATAARNAESAKHGMWKTPEFAAWMGMLRRCYTPSTTRYADYGGRGITVCDEWRKDFKAFFDHIGPRPSARHSLDRIRNAEGYKPGNVRWATDEAQNNNRRSNVTIEIDGVLMTAAREPAAVGRSDAACAADAEGLGTPAAGTRGSWREAQRGAALGMARSAWTASKGRDRRTEGRLMQTHPMQTQIARAFSQRMTKAEAHDLLDAARDGIQVPRHRIIRALIATGDMSRRPPVSSVPADGQGARP